MAEIPGLVGQAAVFLPSSGAVGGQLDIMPILTQLVQLQARNRELEAALEASRVQAKKVSE